MAALLDLMLSAVQPQNGLQATSSLIAAMREQAQLDAGSGTAVATFL
jgi:hypothetical protein